ncbi:microfibril-associated glyco 4-like, partial [Paramuricea clavata]
MLEEYSEHFLLTLWPIDTKVVIVDPSVANITIGESDDIFFCDPNANQYPCHIKSDCVDVPGSFQCTCVSGYAGDEKSCT